MEKVTWNVVVLDYGRLGKYLATTNPSIWKETLIATISWSWQRMPLESMWKHDQILTSTESCCVQQFNFFQAHGSKTMKVVVMPKLNFFQAHTPIRLLTSWYDLTLALVSKLRIGRLSQRHEYFESILDYMIILLAIPERAVDQELKPTIPK